MASTALTLDQTVTTLQTDVTEKLKLFFGSLEDLNSLIRMSSALVEQSKAITVFARDNRGQIVKSDPAAYVKACEQVEALNSTIEQIEELFEPFASVLFKAHRTVTKLRGDNLLAPQGEVKRLKMEREQFASEEERKRRQAAEAAQEEARRAEQERLLSEAQRVAAEGHSEAAEAIFQEAVEVEAPAVVLPSTVPQVAGVSYRSVWEWTLVDKMKLKPEFLEVDEVGIGKIVRSMRKQAVTLEGLGRSR